MGYYKLGNYGHARKFNGEFPTERRRRVLRGHFGLADLEEEEREDARDPAHSGMLF